MKLKDNFTGLFVDEHGGQCCGIQHLYHFPSIYGVEPEERVGWIRKACTNAVEQYDIIQCGCDWDDCEDCEADKDRTPPDKWQCAVELVLNNEQFVEWEPAVLAAGFKQVYEFLNSNSGNTCRVYFFTTGG